MKTTLLLHSESQTARHYEVPVFVKQHSFEIIHVNKFKRKMANSFKSWANSIHMNALFWRILLFDADLSDFVTLAVNFSKIFTQNFIAFCRYVIKTLDKHRIMSLH